MSKLIHALAGDGIGGEPYGSPELYQLAKFCGDFNCR